jgi:hypothetical protein
MLRMTGQALNNPGWRLFFLVFSSFFFSITQAGAYDEAVQAALAGAGALTKVGNRAKDVWWWW